MKAFLVSIALGLCVWNSALAQVFPQVTGGSSTSISGGGGACTVNETTGAIACDPASGQDFTVTVAGGGDIQLLGGNVGMGGASVADRRLALKEEGTVEAAVAFIDSDGAKLAELGVARTTNSIISGTVNLDYIINNLQPNAIIFSTSSNEKARFSGPGNFGMGTTTPGGGGTVGTNILSVANGTQPTTAVANQISLFSKDSSDGTTNATLGFLTEQAVEAIGTFTASHKLKVWINGSEYWLTLDSVL